MNQYFKLKYVGKEKETSNINKNTGSKHVIDIDLSNTQISFKLLSIEV